MRKIIDLAGKVFERLTVKHRASVCEWAEQVGVRNQALLQRLREGWSPERTVHEKFRSINRGKGAKACGRL